MPNCNLDVIKNPQIFSSPPDSHFISYRNILCSIMCKIESSEIEGFRGELEKLKRKIQSGKRCDSKYYSFYPSFSEKGKLEAGVFVDKTQEVTYPLVLYAQEDNCLPEYRLSSFGKVIDLVVKNFPKIKNLVSGIDTLDESADKKLDDICGEKKVESIFTK